MTFGSAPGTGISRAHRSGTLESPISRAATAGNWASRSGVSVKMQLTRSSAVSWLRARISRISSSVAARIASALFSVTELAPRIAISRIRGRDSINWARGVAQALHLVLAQPPVLTRFEAPQAERAEGDPLELADGMADRLAHAADLALAALVHDQLERVGPD